MENIEAAEYQTPENDDKNEYLVRSGPLGMCHETYCSTCPIYLKVPQQRNSNASNIFNDEFPNTLHGDASRRLCTFFSLLVPRIMNPHNKVVQRWNKFFYICYWVAIFVDPLYAFTLSVQENMCLVMEGIVSLVVEAIRIFNYVMQLLNIALQFRLAYISYESWPRAAHLIDDPKEIALKYLSTYFSLDLMVLIASILYDLASDMGAMMILNYCLRLVMIREREYRRETSLLQVIKNLLMFLPMGHVVGSSWYIFALERVRDCLFNACHNINSKTECLKFTSCSSGHAPALWKHNENVTACLSSTSPIKYGIYQDALPLITETSVAKKFAFSMFWGFKQIITLADNLNPNYKFLGEVYFTMVIMGLGVCIFTLLVTNIQKLLQDVETRSTKMELRDRDVEQWMNNRSLPVALRKRIRMAEEYNWAATRGVDEEAIMETLPEDLQRDIRRHLFKFVKKVQIFALMDEPILDVICERLKPKRYVAGSKILRQRSVVQKMVFVVRGKLESLAADGTRLLLSAGDACGEELLAWYLEHVSVRTDGKKVRLPGERLVSNRSIRCLTNVEAFSLGLADLEDLFILFSGFLQNPRVQGAIRYQSPHWRLDAAKRIQAAWRKRKRRCSLHTDSISHSN